MMSVQEFTDLTVILFKGDENGGRTHTVRVDDTHDSDTFYSVLDKATELGWEITSAQVTSFGKITDELITPNHPATPNVLSDLLWAISERPHEWDSIVAFVNAYGLDNFDSGEWEDRRWGGGYDSPADFAMEYWDENRPQVVEPDPLSFGTSVHTGEIKRLELPSYLSIDWDATAEALDAGDFDYERFNGQTFVFRVA